jgi:hypothetical protein
VESSADDLQSAVIASDVAYEGEHEHFRHVREVGEQENRIRALLADKRAGAAFQHPMTDAEREAAIKRAGAAVTTFHAAGKRAEARAALSLMHRLIEGRSEAWKAARTAEIERAINAPKFIEQGEQNAAANEQ